jgi:hypothetical protein
MPGNGTAKRWAAQQVWFKPEIGADKAAVAHGWITLHPSGGYLSFTQAGADLFA